MRPGSSTALLVALLAVALVACARHPSVDRDDGARSDSGTHDDSPASDGDLPDLCGRPRADLIHDVFCAQQRPVVASLADLEKLMGLTFAPPDSEASDPSDSEPLDYATPAPATVIVLAHSTSLSAELISPINPRVMVATREAIIAFNRGIQQVEVAARDRDVYAFNFYLVTFEQTCTRAAGGCAPGALYTPLIESNWTSIRIRDQSELANTTSDCLQCHARGLERPILLMRELDGPWTHFFQPADDHGQLPETTGGDLARDYFRAKGDETYAAVPARALRYTSGFMLQSIMDHRQPLVFDGSRILNERWPWTSELGFASTPSRSATWDLGYQAFKRGEQLALPHFDPRPTDPIKQARLTDAYLAYRNGILAADQLPDFANIFPDDAHTRAELGFETEPDATPAEALVQACTPCHSDVLDQTLSRARFSVDLSRMSDSEIAVAIERLKLPRRASGAMPPNGRRQIHEANRQALIDYLKDGKRSDADDELLSHAARIGMAAEQSRDQRPGPL